MSEFYDAIRWLQNGEMQLLFFIVGYKNEQGQMPDVELPDSQYFKIHDYSEDSRYPVTLLEIRAKNDEENKFAEGIVKKVFLKFRDRPETLICMFDGSYLSSEDLVDEENIGHIYAVKTPEVELLGFSDEYRHSDSWRSDVKAVQDQITGEYGRLA